VITDRLTTLGDLQTKARKIDGIIVRWEKLKGKTQIIQCHRCQKWGHAAANCNAAIKCLKCGDDHATSECSIKKEDATTHNKIKCANCAGSHLANITDCRVYLDQVKYMAEKRRNKAAPKPTFVDAPLRLRKQRDTNTRGGGVAIFLEKDIPFTNVRLLATVFECTAIKLGNNDITIISM
jgi:hypothetical protein